MTGAIKKMQAIILAAGMGKRLKELTQNNTKCMVRVLSLIHIWIAQKSKQCLAGSPAGTLKRPLGRLSHGQKSILKKAISLKRWIGRSKFFVEANNE